MRAQLGSNPASMGSLGGAGVAQVNGLSSSQTNASNGASFGPLRYNPLFKEVDQELRKLKSQFDGIKDYQQQSSSELPRQPRTFVNSALIKPSTSSNELASSSTSIQQKLNFTTAPRVNQSFNSFRTQKPSTAADKSVERKLFKTDNMPQKDPSVNSTSGSHIESVNQPFGGQSNGFSYGSRSHLDSVPYIKSLTSSEVMVQPPAPQPRPNEEETALNLRVREMEIERKEKEIKFRQQLEAEQKERDESIRRSEAKRLEEQDEKITLLTKKVDGLNRENNTLKLEVNRLTVELKETESIKAKVQELHKIVLERESKIQELLILNEEANDELKKKEAALREMEVESGHVKQIVYADKTENAFNVAIRTSLEENQRIKERVTAKEEEIDHVRELNKTLRTQFDALRNEIEIQKLKHMAEMKNVQTAYDIEKMAASNELSSLRKMVTVLDEKFKFLLKEERRKDQFMVGYFKGKIHDPNDKELLVNFFKQFEAVPKMTMSELVTQEVEIQNQLREEIKRLEERIEVDDIIHKELRRQVEEANKRRY